RRIAGRLRQQASTAREAKHAAQRALLPQYLQVAGVQAVPQPRTERADVREHEQRRFGIVLEERPRRRKSVLVDVRHFHGRTAHRGADTETMSGLNIETGLVIAPTGTGPATKCSYTVSCRWGNGCAGVQLN